MNLFMVHKEPILPSMNEATWEIWGHGLPKDPHFHCSRGHLLVILGSHLLDLEGQL